MTTRQDARLDPDPHHPVQAKDQQAAPDIGARELVAAVADDPAGRLRLALVFYEEGPPACREYGRAQHSFMAWEMSRGVLNPPAAPRPGSRWWRAVNARLLVDQTEARLIASQGGTAGRPEVQRWLEFLAQPDAATWYAAHNSSVVSGYLEAADLAVAEPASERWFINLVLVRVLYAHAAVAHALPDDILTVLGAALASPKGQGVEGAVHLHDFYPATYPAHHRHAWWAALDWGALAETVVDDWFVLHHCRKLYEFSAESLGYAALRKLVRDDGDIPCYPGPLAPLAGRGAGDVQPLHLHWWSRPHHHEAAESAPVPAAEGAAPGGAAKAPTGRELAQTVMGNGIERPWPMPSRPWLAYQRWEHILFMHWRVPPEAVRALVPAPLELDIHDGSAWVGVVPLKMADVHLRHLPPVGGISNFPELNLRTYVRCGDRAGVYFFSLDAPGRFDVWLGRHVFHLRYERAQAELGNATPTDDHLTFTSTRDTGWEGAPPGTAPAVFEARYRPRGAGAPPVPGTLEHFLCERYAMFTLDHTGHTVMGEIHHQPWELYQADVELRTNTVPTAAGLPALGPPESALYCPVMENVVWPMVRV